MSSIAIALKQLWTEPVGRWTTVAGMIVMLPLYAATLPASLTGGRIGWTSLRLLTPEQAVIALCLTVLLSQTLGLMVLLMRHRQRASKATAAGGALMACITPLLCCSPLLPLGVGALAVVFPALSGVGPGFAQGFIATHEMMLLLIALALSAVAFYQNAKRVASGPLCSMPAIQRMSSVEARRMS